MRELLPDYMALTERLEALPTHLGEQAKQAEQREIESLIMWVSSFITYVAIVAEAHKHGGQGWLTYDTVFRHNNQGNSQAWNILDSWRYP